ncbi:hypothetical protein ACA910_012389 [Epithemia clementina (nom. ined.)]
MTSPTSSVPTATENGPVLPSIPKSEQQRQSKRLRVKQAEKNKNRPNKKRRSRRESSGERSRQARQDNGEDVSAPATSGSSQGATTNAHERGIDFAEMIKLGCSVWSSLRRLGWAARPWAASPYYDSDYLFTLRDRRCPKESCFTKIYGYHALATRAVNYSLAITPAKTGTSSAISLDTTLNDDDKIHSHARQLNRAALLGLPQDKTDQIKNKNDGTLVDISNHNMCGDRSFVEQVAQDIHKKALEYIFSLQEKENPPTTNTSDASFFSCNPNMTTTVASEAASTNCNDSPNQPTTSIVAAVAATSQDTDAANEHGTWPSSSTSISRSSEVESEAVAVDNNNEGGFHNVRTFEEELVEEALSDTSPSNIQYSDPSSCSTTTPVDEGDGAEQVLMATSTGTVMIATQPPLSSANSCCSYTDKKTNTSPGRTTKTTGHTTSVTNATTISPPSSASSSPKETKKATSDSTASLTTEATSASPSALTLAVQNEDDDFFLRQQSIAKSYRDKSRAAADQAKQQADRAVAQAQSDQQKADQALQQAKESAARAARALQVAKECATKAARAAKFHEITESATANCFAETKTATEMLDQEKCNTSPSFCILRRPDFLECYEC